MSSKAWLHFFAHLMPWDTQRSSSNLTGEKGHMKKEFLKDEIPHGEGPHEANSLHLSFIHMRQPFPGLETQISQLLNATAWVSLVDNTWRRTELFSPNSANSWLTKCEKWNGGRFKPLNSGVVCYAPGDIWDTDADHLHLPSFFSSSV